ncbi:SpoIIE family protein phosphatase [Yinghuangia seranimata]|uniref:SpoIIE family protein phosphatase n=1 Tax=Yinghuangia seranimata TaxID=408067 RepID=UPI00248C757C|nr:SpoIIE family protein phosphatase [Yinghuangia seranimata]MDI2130133.1 SpoIIE family protein phosphatase [Yinghuangia seranimata]
MWGLLSLRSLAGQVFWLQVAVVVLLAAAAAAALVVQAYRDSTDKARHEAVGVAEAFAQAPGTAEAIESPDPTAALQPAALRTVERTGVAYVAVFNADGVRVAHTIPGRIGLRLDIPADVRRRLVQGETLVTTVSATAGRSIVSTTPVFASDGRFVGVVVAGITTGRVGDTVNRQLPLLLGGAAVALTLSAGGTALVSRRLQRQTHDLGPAEITRMYEHHDAVLHAVREGVLITGADGRVLLANDEARRLLDLPPDVEQGAVADLPVDPTLASLLASDRVANDEVHLAGDRLLAVNKRPTAPYGGHGGSVVTLRDTTELRALAGRADIARERLRLLYDAGVRIGTTLDVHRTAEELAGVAVPRFAETATVELLEPVLRGEEPTGTAMRRTALRGGPDDHPLRAVGEPFDLTPGTPVAAAVEDGHAVLHTDLAAADGRGHDPEHARRLAETGFHSLITVPLHARGVVLGVATFWRRADAEPYDEEDRAVAEELAARAALSIDNARRYTREHTLAVTLQRSLLPRELPDQDALEVAYRYLPAQAGVGGDWFDVIPLPGARVALVVGDVVGHGLHAAATMGRLRTAAHNFSTLDLPPEELIGRLDEVVTRIDQEQEDTIAQITGATCLYAIYDPVIGRVTLARAGHPGPAIVLPDGSVTFPEIPGSPPLGLAGNQPLESTELDLPEGSRLVLFTDGLVEHRGSDIDAGFQRLRTALAAGGTERTPEQTCTAVMDAMLPEHPSDDIALLVARTRLLPPDHVATWDVPSDPQEVARVRAACTGRLQAWGLDEIAFTTELILSELITNAIRYATQPIQVRLLHDHALTCEVSDGSSTSPHLRRAAATDEGGRGLFLVAQFADRWGTRYTARGKVIWCEQQSLRPADRPDDIDPDALLAAWDDDEL